MGLRLSLFERVLKLKQPLPLPRGRRPLQGVDCDIDGAVNEIAVAIAPNSSRSDDRIPTGCKRPKAAGRRLRQCLLIARFPVEGPMLSRIHARLGTS